MYSEFSPVWANKKSERDGRGNTTKLPLTVIFNPIVSYSNSRFCWYVIHGVCIWHGAFIDEIHSVMLKIYPAARMVVGIRMQWNSLTAQFKSENTCKVYTLRVCDSISTWGDINEVKLRAVLVCSVLGS